MNSKFIHKVKVLFLNIQRIVIFKSFLNNNQSATFFFLSIGFDCSLGGKAIFESILTNLSN
jgi:hypothetical protein